MVSVLVADNQILTRQGLLAVLATAKGVRIVGQAATPSELRRMSAELQPDVVLVDPFYDDNVTMESLQLIQDQFRQNRILIVSNRYYRHEVAEAIQHGIRNYITKECEPDEIIDAIVATAKGEPFFCEKIVAQLGDFSDSQSDESPSLSVRENEIAHLIAEGKTNKDIAEELFLSVHTVRTHRKNIIKKLGFTFKNAAELMSILSPIGIS